MSNHNSTQVITTKPSVPSSIAAHNTISTRYVVSCVSNFHFHFPFPVSIPLPFPAFPYAPYMGTLPCGLNTHSGILRLLIGQSSSREPHPQNSLWVEHTNTAYLVGSLCLDCHPHGNITMWVEHTTRHPWSVDRMVFV